MFLLDVLRMSGHGTCGVAAKQPAGLPVQRIGQFGVHLPPAPRTPLSAEGFPFTHMVLCCFPWNRFLILFLMLFYWERKGKLKHQGLPLRHWELFPTGEHCPRSELKTPRSIPEGTILLHSVSSTQAASIIFPLNYWESFWNTKDNFHHVSRKTLNQL